MVLFRISLKRLTDVKHFACKFIICDTNVFNSGFHYWFPQKYHTSNTMYLQDPLPKEMDTAFEESGVKKRSVKRSKFFREEALKKPGFWNVLALSTAEEYDLDSIHKALKNHDVYQISSKFEEFSKEIHPEFLHIEAKYEVDNESRDLYIFKEGSVVLWNMSEFEMRNILKFIKPFEMSSYDETIVKDETEIMPYTYSINSKKSIMQNGNICLTQERTSCDFDKYTFSNVMALSVKLGVWESILDRYISSVQFIAIDLKYGNRIKISRKAVLKKTGELFALRHSINLTSGLLDIPDFYWEREDLEQLYLSVCNYFNIPRRTRVMNEKLSHCIELIDLVSSYLSDKHHIRLEWMIIVLIMVEVVFESLHHYENYYTSTSE